MEGRLQAHESTKQQIVQVLKAFTKQLSHSQLRLTADAVLLQGGSWLEAALTLD